MWSMLVSKIADWMYILCEKEVKNLSKCKIPNKIPYLKISVKKT